MMRTIALFAACPLFLAIVGACVSTNRDVYPIDGAGAAAGQGGQDGAAGATGGGPPGGAGGSDCPYEIVRVPDPEDPDDLDGVFNYTLQPLESYCSARNCPATLEQAVSELSLSCQYTNNYVWQVAGCGYTHVGLDGGTFLFGYVFDDATGELVGVYLFDDVPGGPCDVYKHYAGVKPEACFDVCRDGDTGAWMSAGGAGSTFIDLCEGIVGAGGQGPGGAGGQSPGGAGGPGPGGMGGQNPGGAGEQGRGGAGGQNPGGAGGKGTAGVAGNPS